MTQDPPGPADNTIAMLGHAYSLLGFRIVDGVVGAGFPQKPSHSAVFAQIRAEGSRLTELARGANMTPQAMGELVDELEALGYVERRPDPTDRRAKLIVLTLARPRVHRRGHRHHPRHRGTNRPDPRAPRTRPAQAPPQHPAHGRMILGVQSRGCASATRT